MEIGVKCVIIVVILVQVVSRDLNETERAARAAFVQKLLKKQKLTEGKVRLVGGPDKFEGNVYIYHGGRWGAVCDDSWDDAAAHVVCGQWNRSGVATRASQYGEAKRKFWMDDVVCEGTETSLSQCIFSGWGSSDCASTETAGAICTEAPVALVKPVKRRLLETLDENASLRLVGGKDSNEGRVEIYYKGEWGSLCADGWSLYEALPLCRHLGLGFAAQASQTNVFGSSKIVLSGVQCQGNETSLFACSHLGVGEVTCPGDVGHVAAVVCTDLHLDTVAIEQTTYLQDMPISSKKLSGHVAAVVCTDRLADLHLDTVAIERTAHLQDVPMYLLQCAMEENCLSKTAYEIQRTNPAWQYETRRLLRFTAASLNIGNEEFRPYLPKHLWQWHLCHMHYHSMEVFATFDVLNASGHRVAEGHKASFCLEDNTCLPGVEKKYSCKNYGDQGISVNCSDVYQYNIDCQWVDVTDVELGDYTFKVAVNPHARIAEQQFHNNAATCVLRLSETYASVYGCRLDRP